MTEPAILRDAVTLDGTAASAAMARRFLKDVLGRWECEPLLEDAVLCVSEIVANAVVHAESPCELVVSWRPPRLRVEVHDESRRSAIGPRTVAALSELYSEEETMAAMSGRGLYIVASLSEAVGETVDSRGKVVWFELEQRAADRGRAGLAAIVQELDPDDTRTRRAGLDGVLLGVPVALAIRSEDHVSDLRRELKLLGGSRDDGGVGALLAALDALGGAFPYCDSGAEQVRVAAGVQRSRVDVRVPLTSPFLDDLRRVHALLGRADELATSGHLLTRPATPEVRRFWSWSVDELASQLAGHPPSPFTA